MRFLPICTSVLLLAAGAGCSAYLLERLRPSHISLAILGVVLTVALLAYFAIGRQEKGAWIRFGLYGAAMMICAASIWMEIVRPVRAAPSFSFLANWLTRLSGYELGLIAVPPVGFAITFMLWFEIVINSLKYLQSDNRRRRAESDLYGRSKLLGRRFLRRLAKRRGILLGQWGAGRNAKLIGWSLEGSAITVAPPRVGKGALIALNLLAPGDRGVPRLHGHHRPARRALVHRRPAQARVGPPGPADRSLRGGGPAQEGQGNPSASRQKRVLQPARLYQEGERRGARHQCPPGRAAHAAAPGRA